MKKSKIEEALMLVILVTSLCVMAASGVYMATHNPHGLHAGHMYRCTRIR